MTNETMETLKKLGFKGIYVSECEVMRGFLKRVENPLSEMITDIDNVELPDIIEQFIMLGDSYEYDDQYQLDYEYLTEYDKNEVIRVLTEENDDIFTFEYIETLYAAYMEHISMNYAAFTTEYSIETENIIKAGLYYYYYNDTLYITPGSYGVSYDQRLEYLQLLTLKSLSQNSNHINWRETFDQKTCDEIKDILNECDEYITMNLTKEVK